MENAIVTGINDESQWVETTRRVDLLWLELTEKCNLTCTHCYAESSPYKPLHRQLTSSDWQRLLVEAYDLGCRRVQFIGGEPLLVKEFDHLVATAHTLGYISIGVYTNATGVTDERIACFKAYGVKVAVSVYSNDELVHDAITQTAGSFRKTCSAIKRMVVGGVQVRAGYVEMSVNAGHYESCANYFHGLGVAEIIFDRASAVGRLARTPGVTDPAELCGKCTDDTICVANDGSVYPCVMARSYVLGTVQTGTLTEVIDSIIFGRTMNALSRAFQLNAGKEGGKEGKDKEGGGGGAKETKETKETKEPKSPPTTQPGKEGGCLPLG